jgi:hypothetical protein
VTLKRFCEICTRVGLVLLPIVILLGLIVVGASGHVASGGEIIVVVLALYSVLLNYLLTYMLRKQTGVSVMLFFVLMIPSWYLFSVFSWGMWSTASFPVLMGSAVTVVTIVYDIASMYTVYINLKAVRQWR